MRFALIFLLFISFGAKAQLNVTDTTISQFIVGANYKFNLTSGDLENLWGFNHTIGMNIDYKFKSNVTFGVDGGFIFGNQLQNPYIFQDVYNDNGTVTALDGEPADLLYGMRGMNANLSVGYVWNRLGHNPNSGLWVELGAGFLMHKIRIESIYDDVPQLEGDYKKGYDRMHMGICAKQFIGYLFQANGRFRNFYAGLEFIEGFTQNQRNYNFDLEGPDPGTKLDIIYGVKLGWMIPIYTRHDNNKVYTD